MDVTARLHQNNPFSMEAHQSVLESKDRLRQMVLTQITMSGSYGLTSDDVEAKLELPHQTVSARFTELKALGKIIAVDKRRTRSGRNAAVYVVPGQASIF